jgi:hypothetical protein
MSPQLMGEIMTTITLLAFSVVTLWPVILLVWSVLP